jgi:hypothetical protein
MSFRLNTSHEDLSTKFFALKSRIDVAKILDVDDSKLRYHLYVAQQQKLVRH